MGMSGAGLPPSMDTLPYPGADDFVVGVVLGMAAWAATLRTYMKCMYEECILWTPYACMLGLIMMRQGLKPHI